jgi:hypothetical protein
MTLQSHRQSAEETLRREVVHDDSLTNRNGHFAGGVRIWIQAEVQNQFFRSTRNAAEIRVASRDGGIVAAAPAAPSSSSFFVSAFSFATVFTPWF